MADSNQDSTDLDDGHRPLTPDERKALRRLLGHEKTIIQAATDYSHIGWLIKISRNVGLWVSGIVGGLIAWNTFKNGGGFK